MAIRPASNSPWIARKIVGFIFKGVEYGAQAPLMLATDPTLTETTGRYWKEGNEQPPSAEARDAALAARLWETSALACGLGGDEAGSAR